MPQGPAMGGGPTRSRGVLLMDRPACSSPKWAPGGWVGTGFSCLTEVPGEV